MVSEWCYSTLLGLSLGLVLAEAGSEPWYEAMFSGGAVVEPREPRAGAAQHTFWATRGKRGDTAEVEAADTGKWKKSSLKPNGFFIIGKRGFKPNGLFNLKRNYKPNGLFNIKHVKRSFMKPNGLFSTYGNGKRSLSLKPNGLFSLTKRSDSEDLIDQPFLEEMSPDFSLPLNSQDYWGSPTGFFGAYKRSMKPNGLFSIGKRSTDTFYLIDEADEDEDPDLLEMMPLKRQTFWATRGKRDAETPMFWAARGKRGQNFWAVRG